MMYYVVYLSECSSGQSGEKLVNETEYPYREETGVCRIFPRSHGGVLVKDYVAFNFRYRARTKKIKNRTLQGSNTLLNVLF